MKRNIPESKLQAYSDSIKNSYSSKIMARFEEIVRDPSSGAYMDPPLAIRKAVAENHKAPVAAVLQDASFHCKC